MVLNVEIMGRVPVRSCLMCRAEFHYRVVNMKMSYHKLSHSLIVLSLLT